MLREGYERDREAKAKAKARPATKGKWTIMYYGRWPLRQNGAPRFNSLNYGLILDGISYDAGESMDHFGSPVILFDSREAAVAWMEAQPAAYHHSTHTYVPA